MRCPICQRRFSDEYPNCPYCLVPLSAAPGEGASGAVAQGPGAQAAGERGVVARDIRGPVVTGDGNIVITGEVQGGVTIGLPGARSPAPAVAGGYHLAAVRDLLLAAFTDSDLRRLFVYTENRDLRPVVLEFGAGDGLAAMADKVIGYCAARDLLADMLREVERANPRQYAHFAARLRPGSQETSP